MNTYIIPLFREVHYQLSVQADSLRTATQRVEDNGLEAGKLLSSAMTDAQELDEEGIRLYNAEAHPDEVAQLGQFPSRSAAAGDTNPKRPSGQPNDLPGATGFVRVTLTLGDQSDAFCFDTEGRITPPKGPAYASPVENYDTFLSDLGSIHPIGRSAMNLPSYLYVDVHSNQIDEAKGALRFAALNQIAHLEMSLRVFYNRIHDLI